MSIITNTRRALQLKALLDDPKPSPAKLGVQIEYPHAGRSSMPSSVVVSMSGVAVACDSRAAFLHEFTVHNWLHFSVLPSHPVDM